MFASLLRRLRDDRSENSLVTTIAIPISLIVTVAMAGVAFVLITGAIRIQAENGGQIELRTAHRSFTNDVENAARIQAIDDTRVVLTSIGWLTDDDGEPLCRESEWFISPASAEVQQMRGNGLMSLYNDIRIYPSADCSGSPREQHRTAVTAIADTSRFIYRNLAGVDLRFSNSTLVALNGVSYMSGAAGSVGQVSGLDPNDEAEMVAFRAAHDIDAWYTDDEVVREIPRIVTAHVIAILPITEVNDTVFKATTNEAEVELVGNNNGVVDPGGEQTRWIPNPVSSVFITRSTNPSTGIIVGGEREGIRMAWTPRPAAECAPHHTPVYAWTLDDAQGRRTQGETTATSVEIDSSDGLARIWNGGTYEGTVTVRCNDTDGSSGVARGSGTLSLPTPLGVSVSAPGANERAQTVTWQRVSSDPNTTYFVQRDPASSSSTYVRSTPIDVAVWLRANASWTAVGTTGSLSIASTTNAVVPGFPESYRVRASTSTTPASGPWAPGNFIYGSAPTAPSITSLNSNAMTWTAGACPAGTTREFQGRIEPSASAHTAIAVTTATSQSFSQIGQGARVLGYLQSRCSTPMTLDPTNGQTSLSPWSAEVSDSYIRPVSPPSSITMNGGNVTVWTGTYATRYGTEIVGCAAGTTPTWISTDPVSGSSGGPRTSRPSGYCQGAYASSSPVSRSATITWVAPPAPTTPTGGGWEGSAYTGSSPWGGAVINTAAWYGSGSSNVSSYSNQVRVNLNGSNGNVAGWKAWNDNAVGCVGGVINKQGRSMAHGPGGSSGWYTGPTATGSQYLSIISDYCA